MKKIFTSIILLLVVTSLWGQTIQEKMDTLVLAYARDGKFNGNVLVAQKGNILYQKGVGFINAEENKSHDEKSIFQIGSITKQITAAVIMQLVQEGKLSLQDNLEKFFPGFVNGNKITIHHLLSHTSGIYNYTNDQKLMKSDVTKHYSQKQMIDIFKKYEPDFEPGAKWNYSNSGYSLLGYIIEKVTGAPYEKEVRKRIFEPLGMTNSGFDFTSLQTEKKAKGYFSLAGEKPLSAPVVDSTIAYAAGAIYSTVEDLFKWNNAISAGKILSTESWKKVFTPSLNKYGYGWRIDSLYGKLFAAHGGGIHGFASYIIRFPEDDVVVIMLDNASSTSLSQISRSLAAIVFNKPYTVPAPRKVITLHPSTLDQYIGEYQLAPNFIISIRKKGTALEAQATGQQAFDIFAEKEDLFFAKIVEAKIEFLKDENGKVSELILHQNGLKQKGKKNK